MESVLEILSYVFWVLVAITILVFVHEMGHFLFAKLFKMRVDKFSIGFPPKIFGKKIGETEYVVGATPLGGYVKIVGMVDESMDTDMLQSEPEPWEFRAKPVWQRIIVITAGVIFNVIFAAFIFAGLKYTYGETYIPAENVSAVYVEDASIAYEMGLRTGDRIVAVSGKRPERYSDIQAIEALLADPFSITVERDDKEMTFKGPDDIMTQLNRTNGLIGISVEPSIIGGVVGDSPAESIGLQTGDRILALSANDVHFWNELTSRIQATDGESMVIRWERPDSLVEAYEESDRVALPPPVGRGMHGDIYEVAISPDYDDGSERYVLGIYPPSAAPAILSHVFGVTRKDYGLGEAMVSGTAETWVKTQAIVTSLRRVASGRENFRENVGGPIAIAKVAKEAAEQGPPVFWNIVAMLSITLAIMNILPIPALDGGHLVFLIYEGITRREPSLKVRMVLQQVGMVLLLVFMTFLIFNDILRL